MTGLDKKGFNDTIKPVLKRLKDYQMKLLFVLPYKSPENKVRVKYGVKIM